MGYRGDGIGVELIIRNLSSLSNLDIVNDIHRRFQYVEQL